LRMRERGEKQQRHVQLRRRTRPIPASPPARRNRTEEHIQQNGRALPNLRVTTASGEFDILAAITGTERTAGLLEYGDFSPREPRE